MKNLMQFGCLKLCVRASCWLVMASWCASPLMADVVSQASTSNAAATSLTPSPFQPWETRFFTASDSALVTQDEGAVLVSLHTQTLRSPASTLKILTALRALEAWGGDYRWPTQFVVDGDTLTVVGSGDPYLVSEELVIIARAIASRISRPIATVIVDHRAFAVEAMPGSSSVNDPYNAPVSAVAANFNTVQLRRTATGFVSGEAQTPLTDVAQTLANEVARNSAWQVGETKRVNLANADNAHTHFAQLLIAFLRATNNALVVDEPSIVMVGPSSFEPRSTSSSGVPPARQSSAKIYEHLNSKPLSEMLVGALEYSNNFISNHLFLALSARRPSEFVSAAQTAKTWTQDTFGWESFALVDGSGLSPDNRLSAKQMNDVLVRFSTHYELLSLTEYPDLSVRVFAKTGTLSNVRSLAGYIVTPQQRFRFSYFFNRAVSFRHREDALDDLVQRVAIYAAQP